MPIPKAHVALLRVRLVLHLLMPWWAFLVVWVSHVAGWPLIAAGVLGAIIWVVLAIRDMAISKPARIIATTPYAFSRSSMYVGWTLLYTSIALVVNST